MKVDKSQNSAEILIFYSSWNSFRKIIFAMMLVFFQNFPIIQIGSIVVCSGVMYAYVLKYWPFSKFQFNMNKILNELSIILIMLHLFILSPRVIAFLNLYPDVNRVAVIEGIGKSIIVISIINLFYNIA